LEQEKISLEQEYGAREKSVWSKSYEQEEKVKQTDFVPQARRRLYLRRI